MANERKFPRDMSFVDRQGNVVHPSREDYHAGKSVKVGKAYAFFDCNAPITQIEQEIPIIRDLVNTPRRLELYLAERALPVVADNVHKPGSILNYLKLQEKLEMQR